MLKNTPIIIEINGKKVGEIEAKDVRPWKAPKKTWRRRVQK
tara:strand:+ start:398 stop:520 length:123 start_codon:yes stop_codon:yes gene_type:complete